MIVIVGDVFVVNGIHSTLVLFTQLYTLVDVRIFFRILIAK